MGLFPFCLPASFEWSSSFRRWGKSGWNLRKSSVWKIHSERVKTSKKNYKNQKQYTTWRHIISSRYNYDRLWDLYNHYLWRFSENFVKFFIYFCSLSARSFEYFFLHSDKKDDIQTLFWWPFPAVLDPTVRKESFGLKCSYILEIVDTFLSSSFALFIVCLFCLFLYIIGPN